MKVIHPLKPVYDKNSKVLILGSLPSVKSRKLGFYYMHPKNRFWKILSIIYEEEIGISNEEKIEFLTRHKIALFDVVKSCTIDGSSDNSIKIIEVNDIKSILEYSKIDIIFTTGKKAFQLYEKYCLDKTGIEAIYLPSTSPANCRMSDLELINEYSKIKEYTDK